MTSRVTISELQHRPSHKSPWIVRWRVEGSGKVRAFRTKLAADKYRGRLLAADGERYDVATGEPVSWGRTEATTWATHAQTHMRRRWEQWSPTQRRSAAESLMMATLVLLRPRAPQPPEGLRAYLRQVVLVPEEVASDQDDTLDAYLLRWSLPMEELTVERAERVLQSYATKLDGGAAAPTTIARRRAVLHNALRAAVNRRLLDENPLDRSEWRAPVAEGVVEPERVPSVTQVRALLAELARVSPGSGRTVAFAALLGLAGLRPSEATAIKVADLTLPGEGWGEARLRHSIAVAPTRYVADQAATEERGLKKRKQSAVRTVPLAPEVVGHLRAHLAAYPSEDGYVFANARGGRLTSGHFSDTFRYAVQKLHPTGPLAAMTPYTLRHAAASMMLRAGVSAADVAERLGHSTDVLLRVYVRVMDDERSQANALIEAALS